MTLNIMFINTVLASDGLAQDCNNCIANALGLLQYCIKPSIYKNAWLRLNHIHGFVLMYRKISSISRTKSQNLNVSNLVL